MDAEKPRISSAKLLAAGAAFGALMLVLAVIWIALFGGGRKLAALFPPESWGALAVGGLLGAGAAAAEWAVFRLTPLFRREVAMLGQVLDFAALRWYHIAAIALLAAVPEEILFRGALLPELGLWVSALIFGLLHAISLTYFLYASAAGLFLGVLMQWTGNLWTPMAAHAAIDAIMLALLARRVRVSVSRDSPQAPNSRGV